MKKVFHYLENKNNINFEIIFIHNLGNFDGLFLFKALSNYYHPKLLKTIIDDSNSFIIISLQLKNYKLTFKDSLRIFPVSLKKLCEIFKVEGKLFDYKKEFNNLNIFKNDLLLNEFINYSKKDTIALYNALIEGQKDFFRLHNVDITTIVSISSLALKIFRTNYLKNDIPILKNNEDLFIRKSYFGGATDYYKGYVNNLYYYDVNSLYPYAMCKDMPYKLIKIHNNMINLNLNSFFGFCLVEVHCPEFIEKPILPLKYKGKTIFPRGNWTATYFSEELKSVIPLGYKIKLLKGFEYSRIDLFSNYVNYFYNIKMNSSGADRWISKLLLNSLYGIFGRKQELLETVNVYNSDIENYILTNIVKNIIPINDKISTLLIIKNINSKLLRELNISCSVDIKSFQNTVKSNVALASAITSYARIYMMYFKLNYDTIYTDTDSIFTTQKINFDLIGSEIGAMKDEMKGLIIKEAYFLGIKQYGYWFLDTDGKRIEKSVFSGIKRDSISFNEIKELFNGKTLIKHTSLRFFKSLNKLSIKIKSIKISIIKQSDKNLINNYYIPITVNNIDLKNTLFNKLKNFISNTLKKYRKKS